MIEYQLLDGVRGIGPFNAEVNKLLQEGWKLYGHPFRSDHGTYYQAFTRELNKGDEEE